MSKSRIMQQKKSLYNRRRFLFNAISSCSLCCLAATNIFGSNGAMIKHNEKHKFQSDAAMTIQEVYDFTFKQWYIPAMKNLMNQIGKERFIEMLKHSSNMLHKKKQENIDYSTRTLKSWSEGIQSGIKTVNNRLSAEVISYDNNKFEMKFTECLWAKTFREADAPDIGYAGVCYQDYEIARAYHPKLKLIREKTLMQGDEFCHFKWIF